MTDESMLDKIRGLLANATDDGNTPEAQEAYLAKATALMTKHQIDQAMLGERSDRPAEKPTSRIIHFKGAYSYEQASLCTAIAKGFGRDGVCTKSGSRTWAHIAVYGYADELDAIELMFTSLWLQALRGAQLQIGYDAGRTKRMRSSYLLGFAVTIGDRLRQARAVEMDQARAADPGSNLPVLLRSRDDAARDLMWEEHPSVSHTRRQARDAYAYGRGAQDGRNADLGQRREAGRRAIGAGR